MDAENWNAADRYITTLFAGPDAALDAALRDSGAAGLPAIHVSPAQGKLLHLLARAMGARRILEIGTLGGYSTIWLGRAALAADEHSATAPPRPSARVITLEADPKHADVARANIARAGLSAVIEVRLGPALQTLPQLAAEQLPPFDFTFIDADKAGYPQYLEWAIRLSRPGSLIIADNVVRSGAVIDETSKDASVQAVRRFNALLAADPRVSATVIQTVGSKGYDGFALAVVGAKRQM